MKWIKLTAIPLLFSVLLFSLISCEKDEEKKKTTDYSRTGIVLSGAQETPAVTTGALGSMDVSYSRETRLLSYTVRWTGLTAPPSLMHIHGLAPVGYPAPVIQTILSAANPTTFPATGSYSGTFYIDNIIIKEQDLLNGFYYMNIHTPLNPAGEIRGQIRFQ